MAISKETAEAHIQDWKTKLARTRYPFTAKWPARIFRHDPLENIALILNSGQILSRNDSGDQAPVDAAASSVLASNNQAHTKVRMYFRPRTPTQYRMEGIRKVTDIWEGAHAPTIAMMMFDAKALLTREGCSYSTCNMQSTDAEIGASDDFFTTKMNFSKTYHFGPHDNDSTITLRRCAELLLPSPLEISSVLQHVYCRSPAEREYLLSMLNDDVRSNWKAKILISDDMKVFDRRFAYVEVATISSQAFYFKLHPRKDNSPIQVQLIVKSLSSGETIIANNYPALESSTQNWKIEQSFDPGDYLVTIALENHRAYHSTISYQEVPF